MSSNMTPVPKDSPLMIAWELYKSTEDYANTKHWASIPEHREGSLWAAFLEGWKNGELAALRQPPPASGPRWEPIETAPKDGRTILLYRELMPWRVVGYGRWESHAGVAGWISYGFSEPPGNLGLADPTMWQPLPLPPVPTTEEEG